MATSLSATNTSSARAYTVTQKPEPTKTLEWVHLLRALIWPAMLPAIFLLEWQESVFLVICLSLYANFSGDISAWQAARASRHSLENP